jgi:hypothetical protein
MSTHVTLLILLPKFYFLIFVPFSSLYVFYDLQSLTGEKPKTLSADWVAAERDYGKFQGLNPITGKSYK